MATGLTIGHVAEETGVAATTLRYYEQIGLVPVPARVGGQRRYDESVLARLEVIGLCKSAGFALDEIQVLFADAPPGAAAEREERGLGRGGLAPAPGAEVVGIGEAARVAVEERRGHHHVDPGGQLVPTDAARSGQPAERGRGRRL